MNWQVFPFSEFIGRQRNLLRSALLCIYLMLAVLLSSSYATAQSLQTPAERLLNAVPGADDPAQSFRVLCYHDIRDNLQETFKYHIEPTAVDTLELIHHFTWLKENGYHPVSLQQIIDARANKTPLPDKAVLLTFDDGYKSVYDKVFPLLQLFHFPAVIAIVGDWIETPADKKVMFGDKFLPRDQFVNWEEIRVMVASGLVEVASHSHDLHKGIQSNPQGNSLPAAIIHSYNPLDGSYETDDQYRQRIKADLARNSDLINSKLHQRPRVMVWPYGRYNLDTTQWAAAAGMPITMNLESGPNLPTDSLAQVRRTLISFNTGIADLINMLHEPIDYSGRPVPIERVVHVDLDYIYDANPEQQEINLSRLLDRIKRIHPTTVYLQAFADPDGKGVASALYFPNRHLPMRSDLFSRAAWQLRNRVGVNVYAWMPVMAFDLPASDPAADKLVKVMPDAPAAASVNRYHRLSIFDPLVQKTILEIYEDLGKSGIFNGVLFHDDATLSDFEDANPAALKTYHDDWQLPASIIEIRQSPELRQRWMAHKTAYIDAFTLNLAAKLRAYQPMLHTARNLYAQPALNPASEEWYAQSLQRFLANYDFTAVMAMPYMEGASDPDKWLKELLEKVKAIPGALEKTVFELQSRDWKTNQAIPAETLAAQLRWLHLQGARNVGYYPDDFRANIPNEEIIKPEISIETNVLAPEK